MRFRFFIAALLVSASMHAQTQKPYDVFSFRFDNDFVFGTDSYFTNGFGFNFASDFFEPFFLNRFLFPHLTSNEFYDVNVSQEIYTPIEKYSETPTFGDRPFSANLFLDYGVKEFSKAEKTLYEFRFHIGIMGEHAFGEEVQNGIHSLLPPSGEVIGWDNQLSDALLFGYSAKVQKTIANNSPMNADVYARAELGTPNTKVGAGLVFNFGTSDVCYSADYYRSEKFRWQLKLDFRFDYVFYNANLQGGLFTENVYEIPSEDVTRIVYGLNDYVRFIYRDFDLKIGSQFITKEFSSGRSHVWFWFVIGYKF